MPEVQDWIFLLADKFNECGFKVTIVCDCERYYISDDGLIFCPVCDRRNILKNITFSYLIVCGDNCDLTGLNAEVKIITPCDCTQKKIDCINGFSALDDCIVAYFNEYQKDFFCENSDISFVKINTGIDKSLYKDFSFISHNISPIDWDLTE